MSRYIWEKLRLSSISNCSSPWSSLAAWPVYLLSWSPMPVDTAGGDLGGADLHDAVAELRALPGGHGDAHKGQEDAVGAQHLAQLLFPHVQGLILSLLTMGRSRGQERDISAAGYFRWR